MFFFLKKALEKLKKKFALPEIKYFNLRTNLFWGFIKKYFQGDTKQILKKKKKDAIFYWKYADI